MACVSQRLGRAPQFHQDWCEREFSGGEKDCGWGWGRGGLQRNSFLNSRKPPAEAASEDTCPYRPSPDKEVPLLPQDPGSRCLKICS